MDKSNGAGKWMVVIAVAVVVVIVIIFAVIAFGNRAAAPTAAQNGAQPGTASAASYASPNDGFAVNFPGTPQVTNTMFNSMTAGSLPLTTYKSMANSSTNAYYTVMVYHYPASYQYPDNYLMGALQVFGMAVNAKHAGTAITNQTPMQFLGAPALEALVTVPINGANTNDYVLITTRGQDTYVLDAYDVSQSDFNSFIGSFSFAR